MMAMQLCGSVALLAVVFVSSGTAQLISPCPRVFQYEKQTENDRWYGTVTLISDAELSGVWLRLVFDKPSIQLGNWFGEVVGRENNTDYLVKNRNHKLLANAPLQVRFYVRYPPNEAPPVVKEIRLNAKTVCPEGRSTTPAPPPTGQLQTSPPRAADDQATAKPLVVGTNPAATAGGGGEGTFSRPGAGFVTFSPGNSEDDDFFQGDFAFLGKPQPQGALEGTCGIVIKQPRPLITHGQETHEGEFPWHAALYHAKGIDLSYICGASLISRQHLITVAHCVTRRKTQTALSPSNLVVYLGKYYLKIWSNPGIQDRHVDKIIVHSKYNAQTFSNDIAILKLTSSPVEITNYVRPVCLWEGPDQLDKVVSKLGTVVGWGFDETGKVTEQLTKAHMPIVSQETCIYSFPDFYSRFTSSNTFCAGFKNGTSVCNGDSGGGLVLPRAGSSQANPVWQIRGLVSISVALQNQFRCDSTHYVVFTDVAKYINWVKNALTL